MSSQITYKYLPTGSEPTDDQLSKAEPVSIRQLGTIEEVLDEPDVGEVITVADLRYGDEERIFKVVRVDPLTRSRFVEDPGTAVENVNVYVTDAE